MLNGVSGYRTQPLGRSTTTNSRSNAPQVTAVGDGSLFDRPVEALEALDALSEGFSGTGRRQSTRRKSGNDDSGEAAASEDYRSDRDDGIAGLIAHIASNVGHTHSGFARLRQSLPDPGVLALILTGLLDDPALDDAIRKEVQRELSSLIAREGRAALRSSRNIDAALADYACFGLSRSGLQISYATLLAGTNSPSTTYRYVIRQFGFDRRGLGTQFLERCAAVDLGAAVPGKSRPDAKPIFELLFQLRLLRSADTLMTGGAANRSSVGRATEVDANLHPELEQHLVELVLCASDDVGLALRALSDCIVHGVANPAIRDVGVWLRQVVAALERCPIEIFRSLADRNAVINALRLKADRIIYLRGENPVQGQKRYG